MNFHAEHYPRDLLFPISTAKVAQFIAALADKRFKASTIQSVMSGLSYVHQMLGHNNLTTTFFVQKLLSGVRRCHPTSDVRRPITIAILYDLIRALSTVFVSQYDRKLFRSMFSLSFFALLRVGEIAATSTGFRNLVLRHNVKFHRIDHKQTQIDITFNNYKHSAGKSCRIMVNCYRCKAVCPVRATSKYCDIRPSVNGPLYVSDDGNPVQARYFRTILNQCLHVCSLDTSVYKGHSFRIGGATFAHSHSYTDSQLQHLGRWKSTAFRKYIRL